MKKLALILLFLVFQQEIISQTEIIGKVEFYKSNTSEWNVLESFPDVVIKRLGLRNHKIELIQKDSIKSFVTDSTGHFKVKINSKDSLFIKVNKHSPIFNAEFNYSVLDIKDTLKLMISDKKFAVHRDSVLAPEFFKLYSEKQAYLDYEKGIRRILGLAVCFPTGKSKSIEAKYNVVYEYFSPDRTTIRIIYRYNQVMRKLIGIKEEVW